MRRQEDMENILIFDPSQGTLNLGDEIIVDSALMYLRRQLPNDFFIHIPTHTPVPNRYGRLLGNARLKFVCGTNLLKAKQLFSFRQWDVKFMSAKAAHGAILVGCGWWQYQDKVDGYSRALYRHLLSSEYLHSVRDEYTRQKMVEMGFKNVVNTGCPTLWRMTPEFCDTIPVKKAGHVVTTFTDYKPDETRDTELILALKRSYKKVYLWMQGAGDYAYSKKLGILSHVEPVTPTLKAYDEIFKNEDIDYVGTRLHAGIRAMQHGKRALILAVDNRAIEMRRSFGLNVMPREEIGDLEQRIDADIRTHIRLNQQNIDRFLQQFS